MENNIFKIPRSPRFYSLPARLALSFLRIIYLRVLVWWHGGRCQLGRFVRIKHPLVFQGEGQLIISDHVTFGYELGGALNSPILLQPREAKAIIQIGKHAVVMNGSELISRSSITIGANCRIGPCTLIYDADFHGLSPAERDSTGKTAPVIIKDNVWIGSRVIILKGVIIEQDAVVAAGSVVTKSVPPGSIVAGNPAKKIGSVYEPEDFRNDLVPRGL
jgi:acetyltransferase-like isoleucine patch superfamily enzyme